MTKPHTFRYYLHDGYERDERAEFIMGQMPDLDMDEETFTRLIGEPFYEVELVCEFDPATGKVTIVSAK